MDNEHQVVAVVSHATLLNQIAQSNDISNSTGAKPNFLVVSRDGGSRLTTIDPPLLFHCMVSMVL
jgi:hypothetical protein